MRSRYSAFAVGRGDYLWRTWHPRTRPSHVEIDKADHWIGLTIVDVKDGDVGDTTGIVEFIARWEYRPSDASFGDLKKLSSTGGEGNRSSLNGRTVGGGEKIRERSVFQWRAKQWFYLGPETS